MLDLTVLAAVSDIVGAVASIVTLAMMFAAK